MSKNSIYTSVGFHTVIVSPKKLMKTSHAFITGASALLLAIAVTSCSTTEQPASPPAPAAQTMNSTAPKTTSAGTPVTLTGVYNQAGICPDNAEFSGGVDGDGNSCSSNLLGSAQTWNGVTFAIGSANSSNVISCAGQTIPLPAGTFSKLQVLAMAVNGAQASQNFSVIYADTNLDKTFTQNLSDWASPDSNDGESVAVTMGYRNQSDGSRDENTYYIFGYSFGLDTNGAAQGLKLPDNDNVKVFAVTLLP
jgi:hypothetical protein